MKAVGWLTSGIVTSPFFPGRLRNVVIRKWCGGGMLGGVFPHVGIQSNKLKVVKALISMRTARFTTSMERWNLEMMSLSPSVLCSLQQATIIPTRPAGPARCLVVTSK